jgi:hypothetical protein
MRVVSRTAAVPGPELGAVRALLVQHLAEQAGVPWIVFDEQQSRAGFLLIRFASAAAT